MPLYEYRCTSCELVKDQLVSSSSASESEREQRPCPACGSPAVRQFASSGTAVHYKGDWFKTKGSY